MIKKFEKPKPQNALRETKVIEVIQGEKGDTGNVGPEPSDTRLIEIIKPLIPDPIPGENGEDGETPTKEELLVIIKPLIPKVKDGKDGENGLPGKDAEEKTPEEIRDALENLKKGSKLSIEAIDDLADILSKLSKDMKGSGGGKMPVGSGISSKKSVQFIFVDDETPAGVIDGNNTDFILKRLPVAGSLKVYRGGSRQRITEDYTLTHKTISFINAPQVGEILLCDYRVS